MSAIHDGHRDRMRNRIQQNGIESLYDHELLEYILYAFIPRRDTNPIAHNLLDTFGSLQGVFDASPERLEKVEGIGHNTALFLSSLSDISRRYYSVQDKEIINIRNVADCIRLMRPILSTVKKEELHVLLRDSAGRLIKRISCAKGQVNEVSCSIREITDIALRNEAVGVVLIHNHPSGISLPSQQDILLTERIYLALGMIGIAVDDHIIIANDNFYSFKQHGYMEEFSQTKYTLDSRLLREREISDRTDRHNVNEIDKDTVADRIDMETGAGKKDCPDTDAIERYIDELISERAASDCCQPDDFVTVDGRIDE